MSLSKQAGDTIIEVMFAITIFSLLAIGGLSIMNKGTAIAQRALETTLVRQQIDAQIDALRFLNSAYVASGGSFVANIPASIWQDLSLNYTTPSSISEVEITDNNCALSGNEPFIIGLGPNMGAVIISGLNAGNFNDSPATYAQIRYNETDGSFKEADGIWIEAYKPDISPDSDPLQDKIGYIDFYIRACWHSVGQQMPMVIQTVVRLYEPKT